jgi:hypothetical protein
LPKVRAEARNRCDDQRSDDENGSSSDGERNGRVWQGGYEPKRPRRDEQRRADGGVEEQDDATRCADACDVGARDPQPDERDLQRLTTARREIGVRSDPGGVGRSDVE